MDTLVIMDGDQKTTLKCYPWGTFHGYGNSFSHMYIAELHKLTSAWVVLVHTQPEHAAPTNTAQLPPTTDVFILRPTDTTWQNVTPEAPFEAFFQALQYQDKTLRQRLQNS